MDLNVFLLVVAIVIYIVLALDSRLRSRFDMTALGLALICLTLLVLGGEFG